MKNKPQRLTAFTSKVQFQMANISPVLRKVNKGTEQPVYVRYSHAENGKNKDYFAPVGFSINPANFKKGKVTGTEYSVEANAKIQAVVNNLEKAIRLAGTIPTVQAVKGCYLGLPTFNDNVDRLFADWNADGKSKIEVLQHEIEELKAAIVAKESEIVKLQIETGAYKTDSINLLIDKYITHRNAEKSTTKKRTKNSFASATQIQYEQLQKQLLKFNPSLSIRAIDKQMMLNIEAFFVSEKYYNSSTQVFMQKLKAILNHYQTEYELGTDYKKYSFELPLREDNVIYLTSEELKAFRNVSTKHWHPLAESKGKKVKDLALLMSETALRFCDSAITRTDIQGGYIIKNQQKTGGKVYIPFTKRLKAICEKYDYKLSGGVLDNWNDTFRRLLSTVNVDSLKQHVTVMNYIGNVEAPDTRLKWEHCSAHTLRRTMINQCLIHNLRYDKITKITGHKDFDTFQTYVDSNTKAAEMDEVFVLLNELTELPLMKVA